MFPFFQACQATQTHFVVRASQNRRVQEGEEEITSSLTQARSWPSQASRPFEVPARHGHPGRSTHLQLAFGQMTLLPPRNEPRASKGNSQCSFANARDAIERGQDQAFA
jgi:hypothetical protein